MLVPVNDEMVKTVDRAARTLHVALPDGLLDIYTQEVKVKEPRVKKRKKPAPAKASAEAPAAADGAATAAITPAEPTDLPT